MEKLRRFIKILEHDEKLQNALMAFSCFAIIGIIALYCWLFG